MVGTIGKLLEKMIKYRLSAAIGKASGLSERQHGFKAGRSTLGVIKNVEKQLRCQRQMLLSTV